MSRKSIFESRSPGERRNRLMTYLFDLLLASGYLTCAVLTYFLFFSDQLDRPRAAPPPATPTPVVAEVSPGPTPATPESSPTPAAPELPISEDLIVAMTAYVNAVDQGQVSQARAMRADSSVPSVENMKQVSKMELLTLVSYPRLSRSRGAVYVKLRITKNKRAIVWKGRIDWERRGEQWVTTNWDSAAPAPLPEPPAAPDGVRKR
ncbi:MAG: hypothetical protein P9L99_06705 [Candidatus Lernaella stagnicola]|nr:hypothetical protein [Candidatus Lernaella stagnicola]